MYFFILLYLLQFGRFHDKPHLGLFTWKHLLIHISNLSLEEGDVRIGSKELPVIVWATADLHNAEAKPWSSCHLTDCVGQTARSCPGRRTGGKLYLSAKCCLLPVNSILWKRKSVVASGEETSWGTELWDEQTAPAEQGALLICPAGLHNCCGTVTDGCPHYPFLKGRAQSRPSHCFSLMGFWQQILSLFLHVTGP